MVMDVRSVLRQLTLALLFMVPCLAAVTLKFWYGLAVLLIAISVASWLMTPASERVRWQRDERFALLGILLFAIIVAVLDATQQHKSVAASRVMTALLLFPLVRTLRIGPDGFLLGCVAGALAAAGLGMWQHWVLGQERVIGTSYYNLYAAQALALGLLPAVVWRAAGQWLGWRKVAAIAALLACACAALLSGSRGAWVAAAIVAVWWSGASSWRNACKAAGLVIAAVILAYVLVPSFGERWLAGVQDISAYRAGMGNTSLGMRLDMWLAAWDAFLAHPWLGLGPERFDDWLVARATQGLTPPALAALHFSHAHNEVLNTLATTGLLGLVGLLALQLGMWRCLHRIPRGLGTASGAARGGTMLIVLFAALGLSDVMFYHHRILTLYCVMIVLLLAWSAPAKDDDTHGDNKQ